jgi:hypothetical protein
MPRPGGFTIVRDPVPIVQGAGWAPGPVWTGAENLASTGMPSPDCPARRESGYQLRYTGQHQLSIAISFKEVSLAILPGAQL